MAMTMVAGARGHAETMSVSGAGAVPIGVEVFVPPGGGRHAAVVMLHSCLGPRADRAVLGKRLTAAGFVAAFVDDFAGRGLKETCSIAFPEVSGDALAALAALKSRRDVDPDAVAVLGFSQGGGAALELATSAGGAGFRAAVAFYPPCADHNTKLAAIPTLVLVGDRDDVTPAADCRALRGARLVVIPNAEHVFDDPAYSSGRRWLGMRLAYDAAASRKAWRAALQFLSMQLRR